MKIYLPTIAMLFLAATAPAAEKETETVLLNDNFDSQYLTGGYSGDVQTDSVQDLPNSACWFVSYRTGGNEPDEANVVFSPEAGMTLRTIQDVTVFNVMASFTDDPGTPVTLAVGESLRLTFTLSVKNPRYKYRSFVIGLLNSHGSQVAHSYYANKENASAPFGGYLVTTSFAENDNAWGTVILKRNPSKDNPSLYHGETTSEDGMTGDYHGQALSLDEGTPTEGSLTITRLSETENAISFSLNNLDLDAVDTTGKFTSFDSVNFSYPGPDSADSITLHHIKVTLIRPGKP